MLEVIKKRRSVRAYQEKPVEEEKIWEILKAVQMAPSANHHRPWEFVVVQDKNLKEKLSQATPWGGFISQAPVAIVLCADEEKSRHWLEDAAIVGGYLYLEVTNQGLGTCWVQVCGSKTEGGEESEEYVRNLLGIPQNFQVVAVFPLGYPAQHLEPHQESEFEEEKVHLEKW